MIRWALALVLAACGGTVIGGDAGSQDATITDTGADSNACTYKETRTNADRTCMSSTDCTIVVRSVTCCMEQHGGIRTDAAMRFNDEQKALTAGCLGCGCAAQPVDDLGVKGSGNFTVRCDMGQCTSHAQ